MKLRNFFTITLPVVLLLAVVTSIDALGLDRLYDQKSIRRKRRAHLR